MGMLPNKLKKKFEYLADYFDKPAWINRTLFYATILLSIALVFLSIIGIFKLLFSDFSILNNVIYTQNNATQLNNMGFFDNERYLLSALVQSLAATIALVITLSLVAVQLAAQSYSARVIDVYKTEPRYVDTSLHLHCYYFLRTWFNQNHWTGHFRKLHGGRYFYGLLHGVLCFCLSGAVYVEDTGLAEAFDCDYVVGAEYHKRQIYPFFENEENVIENNPIQPIVDIANSSLERNDYESLQMPFLQFKNLQFP
ncbi:MAG: hypothetical protein R2741_04220 [Methanolobus sp.]